MNHRLHDRWRQEMRLIEDRNAVRDEDNQEPYETFEDYSMHCDDMKMAEAGL